MTTTPPDEPPVADDPDFDYWESRAYELRTSQLGTIRGAAEKWRTGLAGMTTLLSVVAVLKAPDLGVVSAPWRSIVVVLALGGLITLLVGTGCAMRAAFGLPGKRIPLLPERVRDWDRAEVASSVRFLYGSQVSFVIGLALILLAIGLAFFAQSIPAPTVRVTTTSGVVCGRLGTATKGIEITSANGRVMTIPITGVEQIQTATC